MNIDRKKGGRDGVQKREGKEENRRKINIRRGSIYIRKGNRWERTDRINKRIGKGRKR